MTTGIGIHDGPVSASIDANHVSGSATGSINSQTHVGIGGNVTPAGTGSVRGNLQIGNSAGAQSWGHTGGNLGQTIGSTWGPEGSLLGSFLGSGFGSVLGGRFGGGPSGSQIRSGYRDGLVQNGFATKGPDGSVNVPLADGTKYNLAQDGGNEFTNKDGTKRFSYEVDWTKPVAADSIPTANLLQIATGLDPSMNKKDLFNRTAGQFTNAISSNAQNVGDSYKNAKSILDAKGVDAQSLGMRLEALRNTNTLSDQEYKVYLDQVNKVYGTKFQPQSADTSRESMIQTLQSQKNLSKPDKQLLSDLMDEKKLSSNKKTSDARTAQIDQDFAAQHGRLPTLDRYANQNDSNLSQVI